MPGLRFTQEGVSQYECKFVYLQQYSKQVGFLVGSVVFDEYKPLPVIFRPS